jgi:hypothetical protein
MVSRLLLSKLLRVKGARWTPLSALAQVRGEQDPESCRKAVLEEVLRRCKSAGTSLDVEVRSSSIPGAGVGVFATADISAGTVLATYGGRFIPPIPVPPTHGAPPTELCDLTGDYIYCCEGGGYLDGSHCLDRSPMDAPHSLGHLVNHPPSDGGTPNAVSVTISPFPENLGVTALPAGKPWYFDNELLEVVQIPSSRLLLKGVALVSLVDIEKGSEIYYDYGIKPEHSQPEWYSSVDRKYLEEAVNSAQSSSSRSSSEEEGCGKQEYQYQQPQQYQQPAPRQQRRRQQQQQQQQQQ